MKKDYLLNKLTAYLKDFHILANNYQIQIPRLTKKLKNCSLYYGGRSLELSINKWRTTNISWRRGNILVSELTFFHLRFLSYGSGEFYFFNSYDWMGWAFIMVWWWQICKTSLFQICCPQCDNAQNAVEKSIYIIKQILGDNHFTVIWRKNSLKMVTNQCVKNVAFWGEHKRNNLIFGTKGKRMEIFNAI